MAISAKDLTKAYLAYFGRPVDLTGSTYFAKLEKADVIAAFDASAESQALYGTDLAAKVNAIYQNLFGRPADAQYLPWWIEQVTAGNITPAGIAFAILEGAQGTDVDIINNKVEASEAFTAALDTTEEMVGYAGLPAAATARAWLAKVDGTPESLAAAQASVDATVAAATGQGSGGSNEAGVTTVLTTGQDIVNGTAKDDFFRAVAGVQVGSQDQTTLNSSDIVDGLGGNDTLIVNLTGPQYLGGARIKNIETLQIGTNLAAATFDYNVNAGQNEITEVQTIIADQIEIRNGVSEDLTINNLLKTGDALPVIHWKNEAGAIAGEVDVNYRASAVAGTDTVQGIKLENVLAQNGTASSGVLNIAGGVETFNIESTGSANKNVLNPNETVQNLTAAVTGELADLASGNGSLTNVVVTGAAAFGEDANVITGTDGRTNRVAGSDLGITPAAATSSNLVSLAHSVATYDASAATGAQSVRFTPNANTSTAKDVTFKGGSANDYVEFELGNINANGGAGDDVFAFINGRANSTFGEGDTINGGEGNDTIQLGVNGSGAYNVSETELRNKESIGTLDLRGNVNNLSLSSDFVAKADTANSITVRTDKIIQSSDTSTANLANGTQNGLEDAATSTINLTKLSSNQTVDFFGGSGSDRIILNDATFNVLKKLDGGDFSPTTAYAAGATRYDTLTVVTNGENVVLDAQDLSNVKNFEGLVLTKNSAAAQYNIWLTNAFLAANTKAVDDATTTAGYNDTVFQIGTVAAANNSALAAGDTVTLDITDLFTSAGVYRATGRSIDVASLESAGVNVRYVYQNVDYANRAALQTANPALADSTLWGGRGTGVATANAADVLGSAANPVATAPVVYAFTGTAAADTYTLAANTDNVQMLGGNDTLTIGAASAAPTGRLEGGDGTGDSITLTAAVNLSGATITGFETVTGNFATSYTSAQFAALQINNTAAVTLVDAANVTAQASAPVMVLSNFANNVDLSATAAFNVTGGALSDTFTFTAGYTTADTVNGGAGSDTLVIAQDIAGAAFTNVSNIETLKVTASQTGNITLQADMTTLDAGSLTTGLTLAATTTALTSAKFGSGNDVISALTQDAVRTIDLGAGNATVAVAAGGANVQTFKMANTTGATTTLNITAGSNLVAGTVFDFAQDVAAIKTSAANVVNQAIVEQAGGNTTVTFDINGDGAFSAGEYQIVLTGQLASFGITAGNLVIA